MVRHENGPRPGGLGPDACHVPCAASQGVCETADGVRMFASGNRAISEAASAVLYRLNRRRGVRGVPSIANRRGSIGAIRCAIVGAALMLPWEPRDRRGGVVPSATRLQKWRRRYPSSCAIAEATSARSMSCSSCVPILRSLTLPAASSSPPMITMWLAPSLSACLNCALSDLPW